MLAGLKLNCAQAGGGWWSGNENWVGGGEGVTGKGPGGTHNIKHQQKNVNKTEDILIFFGFSPFFAKRFVVFGGLFLFCQRSFELGPLTAGPRSLQRWRVKAPKCKPWRRGPRAARKGGLIFDGLMANFGMFF